MVKKTYKRKTYRKRVVKKRNTKKYTSQGLITLNRKCWLVSGRNDSTTVNGSFGLYPIPVATGLNTHVYVGTPEDQGNGMYSVGFSILARLDNLVSYADFTAIADRYKIVGLETTIRYTGFGYSTGLFPAGEVISGNSQTFSAPYLEYVYDYDDFSPPDSNATWRQKMGIKTRSFKVGGSSLTIRCRPKPVLTGENTGAADAQMIVGKSGWIDCGFPSVPHLAIKGMFHNMMLPKAVVNFDCTNIIFDTKLLVKLKDIQ